MIDRQQLQSICVTDLLHRLHDAQPQFTVDLLESIWLDANHLGRFWRSVLVGTDPEPQSSASHEIADEVPLLAIKGEQDRTGR